MIPIKPRVSYLIFFAFFVTALLWNLGITPIGTDEPTRTVVAQEIMLSNNWFLTTINGDPYYNKPPLYNWLLIALYEITGSKSEFVARIPVVASILGIMLTLFFWVKKYTTKENALLAGLIFATGSRIWFYDSLLGLIDMFFGMLILWVFILVFELQKKGKYFALFGITYFLIACCFLMKGLQAIAFQGVTLLTWFLFKKEFRRLFGLAHIFGIFVFASILGLYLFAYSQYHPIETLLNTLWTESSKRTVGGRAWYEDLFHILSFPIKNVLLDLMPWGIVLLALIKKDIRKRVLENELLVFILVIVGANLLIYWLSPETRGRYLFPHYALLSVLIVFVLDWFVKDFKFPIADKVYAIVLAFFPVIPLLILALVWSGNTLGVLEIFLERREFLYGLLVLLVVGILLFFYSKDWKNTTWQLLIVLLAARLSFDAIVLPQRLQSEHFDEIRSEAKRIGRKYKDKKLVIYRSAPVDHSTTHYLTIEQERIIPRVYNRINDSSYYYLIAKIHMNQDFFTPIDSMLQEWSGNYIYVAE